MDPQGKRASVHQQVLSSIRASFPEASTQTLSPVLRTCTNELRKSNRCRSTKTTWTQWTLSRAPPTCDLTPLASPSKAASTPRVRYSRPQLTGGSRPRKQKDAPAGLCSFFPSTYSDGGQYHSGHCHYECRHLWPHCDGGHQGDRWTTGGLPLVLPPAPTFEQAVPSAGAAREAQPQLLRVRVVVRAGGHRYREDAPQALHRASPPLPLWNARTQHHARL